MPLVDYQQAKTGALFVGATMAGAASAGADPEPWRALGEKIGEAYQVADDLRDVLCTAEELGKPIGQDAARDAAERRSAARRSAGAKARLEHLVEAAVGVDSRLPGARRAARGDRGADADSSSRSSSRAPPPDRLARWPASASAPSAGARGAPQGLAQPADRRPRTSSAGRRARR